MSNTTPNYQCVSYSKYETEVFQHFSCINVDTSVSTDHWKKSISHLFFCPYCGEEPGYYHFYNGLIGISPHVHFHCYTCPYQWMLCCLCTNQLQPSLLSKRDQRRSIKKIFSNLQGMMKKHTVENHSNLLQESLSDNMEDDNHFYFDNQNEDNTNENSIASSNNQDLKKN